MRPYLLLLLLGMVVCCTKTSEVKAESHETLKLDEEAHATHHESETVNTGAVDKNENTRTQDVGVVAQAPDGSIMVARVARGRPLTLPSGSKIVGTLAVGPVRTSDSNEHQAPSTATFDASGCEDVGLKLDANKDAKTEQKITVKAGISWLVWLGIGAGLVVAVLVLWKLGKLAFLAKL